MNYALSRRHSDRHPVGLVIVVGLHVALAAVLLSARLHTPPALPPTIALTPLEPTHAVPPPPDVKLPPPRAEQLKIVVPVPTFDHTDPDPIRAERVLDDRPVADPPIIVDSVGEGPVRREVPHFAAHGAVLDAGAAQCRPAYPAAAQRAGAEGTSRIRFTVDALGHVVGAQILQSSGATREHRLLDKAAADALAQCPVKMGIDGDGRPAGGTADVEYRWTLN